MPKELAGTDSPIILHLPGPGMGGSRFMLQRGMHGWFAGIATTFHPVPGLYPPCPKHARRMGKMKKVPRCPLSK
ncbi:hypothetical protein QPR87_14165 [Paracoccus sp. SSJ]|nr:hypothetical protein [Paracoccus sp. SSJ]